MTWNIVWDVVGALFLIAGCSLTLVASIGMFRYDEMMARLHISTKPQVLSLILCLIGAIFFVRDVSVTWTLILVIMFQLMTSPISAHMLSRTGYRTGRVDTENMTIDELREDMRFRHEHETETDGK
ncbi:multicomponent Na+:H+ antiporter subunit G [Actinobaculum suis]|uniref:Monovalent cation/H(+) antiporter subunit G n=1 Tax=Actinobaculum suis TaxID=1657 RepID=A0A0K9ESZ1_9ACTO|nr:monovalent cation/H(+) antiporter subunit G [Actinobaculum suis]KMY22932.1 multisubunit sodium/proton antiporter subunit MrpG [Actinobaculum suis]MDY5152534.1 monovalent cation/H(+) antiporter subunit G [Actinobaculum suis]OCA94369.1 sodium:proton antiporter [Actinobaculum suis]OCA94764.1 sodium:proton antiporter [Actinobaculum suis]SDE39883.1 multicomponent Na+:H+ antiporter subunit G [Actinobaculum suis]